jgi:hypothetical protein
MGRAPRRERCAATLSRAVPEDDQLFFQIAAGLLPALIFGGLLTDRLRPPRDGRPAVIVIVGVVTFLGALFMLYAEGLAISNAIAGGFVGKHERIVVSGALVGATVLVLGLIVVPWFLELRIGTAARAIVTAACVFPLVWGGIWAIDLLDASIELAQTRERFRDKPAARREAQAITERYFDLTREQIRLRSRRAAIERNGRTGHSATPRAHEAARVHRVRAEGAPRPREGTPRLRIHPRHHARGARVT